MNLIATSLKVEIDSVGLIEFISLTYLTINVIRAPRVMNVNRLVNYVLNNQRAETSRVFENPVKTFLIMFCYLLA